MGGDGARPGPGQLRMRIYGQRLTLGLVAALAVAVPFVARPAGHDGTISTVAGTGTSGSSGDLGPATLAELHDPQDVAPLPGGGFLVADTANHVVREVDALGTISRVAGRGPTGSRATAARPRSLTSATSRPSRRRRTAAS